MSGYVLRPRAEADLEDIWRYTAERWSVAQADKYVGQIVAAFKRLAEAPLLGRDCSDIRPGYRRHGVGSHVIFYLLADPATVDVVRVLHQVRDFPRHL